jgi:hypothetical protein
VSGGTAASAARGGLEAPCSDLTTASRGGDCVRDAPAPTVAAVASTGTDTDTGTDDGALGLEGKSAGSFLSSCTTGLGFFFFFFFSSAGGAAAAAELGSLLLFLRGRAAEEAEVASAALRFPPTPLPLSSRPGKRPNERASQAAVLRRSQGQDAHTNVQQRRSAGLRLEHPCIDAGAAKDKVAVLPLKGRRRLAHLQLPTVVDKRVGRIVPRRVVRVRAGLAPASRRRRRRCRGRLLACCSACQRHGRTKGRGTHVPGFLDAGAPYLRRRCSMNARSSAVSTGRTSASASATV